MICSQRETKKRGVGGMYFFYICVFLFLIIMVVLLVVSCQKIETDSRIKGSDGEAKKRVCLDVDNIMQKPSLPNGCEAVSLAIALNYVGYSVDPLTLYDEYMPKSPYKNGDPWISYIGDAKNKGLGCYAPCVVITGNAYLDSIRSSKDVHNVSYGSFSYYKSLIDEGVPVIMWGTIGMNRNASVCWSGNVNGKRVMWHTYSHCLVLIGYTDDTYIFCDPLVGITEYDKISVEHSFEINFEQACIIR